MFWGTISGMSEAHFGALDKTFEFYFITNSFFYNLFTNNITKVVLVIYFLKNFF